MAIFVAAKQVAILIKKELVKLQHIPTKEYYAAGKKRCFEMSF